MKPGSGDTNPFDDESHNEQPDVESPIEDIDTTESADTDTVSRDSLPWIYRRESVQDGRVKTVQLHLQNAAATKDRKERAQLQQQSLENLKKADFREAVYLAGLENLDDVTRTLQQWGYEFGE